MFPLDYRKRLAGFNTQPPEGGWSKLCAIGIETDCFNTQPPEGGWPNRMAAAYPYVCFNTQPPEGGWKG